jgi:hypothetical protein
MHCQLIIAIRLLSGETYCQLITAIRLLSGETYIRCVSVTISDSGETICFEHRKTEACRRIIVGHFCLPLFLEFASLTCILMFYFRTIFLSLNVAAFEKILPPKV